MSIDNDWYDRDSGPFCRHWSGAGDCDEVCATCGHSCNGHTDECRECECVEWKDEEDIDTLKSRAEVAFSNATNV